MSTWILIIVSLVPHRDAYTVITPFKTKAECEARLAKEQALVVRTTNAVQYDMHCKEIKQ